jgi:hypothetical protein
MRPLLLDPDLWESWSLAAPRQALGATQWHHSCDPRADCCACRSPYPRAARRVRLLLPPEPQILRSHHLSRCETAMLHASSSCASRIDIGGLPAHLRSCRVSKLVFQGAKGYQWHCGCWAPRHLFAGNADWNHFLGEFRLQSSRAQAPLQNVPHPSIPDA